MSKIGLYIQVGHDPDIRGKLLRLKPGVVLLHLDGGDLAAWIKQQLPETFVVGRLYLTPEQQDAYLPIPGEWLADMALAQKEAAACDAFMLFNEYVHSPYDAGWAHIDGKPDKPQDAAWMQRARRYDALQVEFREAILKAGKEAVAFNFPAGNWARWEWYRDLQPLTWASYKYIGHHVYGWPRLMNPDPSWLSNMAATMAVCDASPGKTHIITELAVTRAYNDQGPDVGWLSDPNPLQLSDYAEDLRSVNAELCRHPNVLGACLFNAAPDAKWQTFAVTADLVGRLAEMPDCPQPQPEPKPQPPKRPEIKLRLPFDGAHPMTQEWGANPETYARWGLKGHEGVDWAMPVGTPVLACADGVVLAIDTIAGDPATDPYGIHVRLQHDGYITVYAHLSKVAVSKGQRIKAGDKIGLSGNTGNSTGPHLHLSFRLAGANKKDGYSGYSDPMPYMVSPTVSDTPRQLIEQAAALLDKARALL